MLCSTSIITVGEVPESHDFIYLGYPFSLFTETQVEIMESVRGKDIFIVQTECR